jgi:hypothetical protein
MSLFMRGARRVTAGLDLASGLGMGSNRLAGSWIFFVYLIDYN